MDNRVQRTPDVTLQTIQGAQEKEAYAAWFEARVMAGLQDVREGRILSHDEVKTRQDERRTLLRQRIARQT